MKKRKCLTAESLIPLGPCILDSQSHHQISKATHVILYSFQISSPKWFPGVPNCTHTYTSSPEKLIISYPVMASRVDYITKAHTWNFTLLSLASCHLWIPRKTQHAEELVGLLICSSELPSWFPLPLLPHILVLCSGPWEGPRVQLCSPETKPWPHVCHSSRSILHLSRCQKSYGLVLDLDRLLPHHHTSIVSWIVSHGAVSCQWWLLTFSFYSYILIITKNIYSIYIVMKRLHSCPPQGHRHRLLNGIKYDSPCQSGKPWTSPPKLLKFNYHHEVLRAETFKQSCLGQWVSNIVMGMVGYHRMGFW